MVHSWHNKIRFEITGSFAILLALILLVLPLRWIAAATLAALIHELCHGLAVCLCGGRISAVRLNPWGVQMEILPLSRGRELICALAGPLGGLLLLPLAGWFPRTAVCAVFHSLYNLLPAYPLDGGRALRCGALLLMPQDQAAGFCRAVQYVLCAAMAVLSAYAVFVKGLGLLPAAIAFTVIYRAWPNRLHDFPS